MPLGAIVLNETVMGQKLRHESVKYRWGAIFLLTWAGMRGGNSIALALRVPDSSVEHAVPGHVT